LVIWSFGYLVIGGAGMACALTAFQMSSQSEGLKERTMQFALDVLRLVDNFPRTIAGDVIARQLARSATSVASNYRATCNARSRAEFIAKLGIVVEESDESEFWLDTVLRKPIAVSDTTGQLRQEAGELRAIFAKSLGTARANARLAKSRSIRAIPNAPITK
jgi:four helix bundle protein